MSEPAADIRELDTTGLKLVCDHEDMTIWDMGDGSIVRSGDRTQSARAAQDVFKMYDAAFRATGITPQPFEVVRVGDRFGIVVEYVRGLSLGVHATLGSYSAREAGEVLGEMALRMHRAHMHAGSSMRTTYLELAQRVTPFVPEAQAQRLIALIQAVPDCDTLLHGDIHLGNVIINKSGAHLIDMDTLGFGHPVFDLASIKSHIFTGLPQKLPEISLSRAQALRGAKMMWESALRHYLVGYDEDAIAAIAVRVDVLAQLMICSGGPWHFRTGEEATNFWIQEHLAPFKQCLDAALPQVSRLDF